MTCEEITAAFQHGRPDADLLLHETVEAILNDHWCDRIKLDKIRCAYAAAKPSAPAELVQAVRDGDITSHKQYQEALAEIRARDAKITDLLDMSEAADRRADESKKASQQRAWYEANREKVAEYNRRYYQKRKKAKNDAARNP